MQRVDLFVAANGAGGRHQGLAHDLPAEEALRSGYPVVPSPAGEKAAAVRVAAAAGREAWFRRPGAPAHLKRSSSSRSRFSTLVISTLRRSPGGGRPATGPGPGPPPAPPPPPGAAISSATPNRRH